MVRVVGGGPAGAAAAIAALAEGANVEIYEQSPVPRRKVCGEFLSPGVLIELDRLGVRNKCAGAKPAIIHQIIVHVGTCERRAQLTDPAWGLSRYRVDQILLQHAQLRGARLIPEQRAPENVDVDATGRPAWFERLGESTPGRFLKPLLPAGSKIRYPHSIAFSAHFSGEPTDAAEMFFFAQGCVGISPIEGGMVNVCALIRESEFELYDSAPDTFLASRAELSERLRLLSRATDWLVAGPVIASEDMYWRSSGPYLAGDALISPEPFTGSGVLTALITGRMAGVAATYRYAPAEYYRQVSGTLGWRTLFGSAVAAALDTGWARLLAPVTPLHWVFRLGQPRVRKETPH